MPDRPPKGLFGVRKERAFGIMRPRYRTIPPRKRLTPPEPGSLTTAEFLDGWIQERRAKGRLLYLPHLVPPEAYGGSAKWWPEWVTFFHLWVDVQRWTMGSRHIGRETFATFGHQHLKVRYGPAITIERSAFEGAAVHRRHYTTWRVPRHHKEE